MSTITPSLSNEIVARLVQAIMRDEDKDFLNLNLKFGDSSGMGSQE